MVAFVPHETNIGTCTLNVDGLGAKALRSAPSVEITAGTLVQGTPYVATYFNAANEWRLQGCYGPNDHSVPLGAMLDYTGQTAPNSRFVLPYGQAISRTTYAAYFALAGTTYGAGDGSTTFNVPDLRGRYVAANDGMGGVAASRITNGVAGFNGTIYGATGGGQSVTLSQANLPNVSLSLSGSVSVSGVPTVGGGGGAFGVNAGLASPQTYGSSGAGNLYQTSAFQNFDTLTSTGSITGGSTSSINGGVGQAAFSPLPPTIVLAKILCVL
jgi:microcystin-dependent protein